MPIAFLFLSLRKLSWLHLYTFLRGNNQVRYSITCQGLHLAKRYKLGTSTWSLYPARTLSMVGWNYSPDGDYLFHRHNPLARQKNKMTHPVDYQKGQDKDKVNYINPLCYIRRIMYNLSGVGVRRRAI
jgi:hypothetical protein